MFVKPFLSTEWRAFARVDEARSKRAHLKAVRPDGRSYPYRDLGPTHHRSAVEKFHDAGLDRRRSVVREHGRRDDHVAAVVEGDRQRGSARRIAGGKRIGAAAA